MNLIIILCKFYINFININKNAQSVFKRHNIQDVLFIRKVHAAQSTKVCSFLNSGPLHVITRYRPRAGLWSEMQPSSAGQALCPAPFVVKLLREGFFVMGTKAHWF